MGKEARATAMRNLNREALAKQGPVMELSEAEKINLTILLEKVQELQTQFKRVNIAVAGLVGQIVQARGLDPDKFGVNLGAGKILPIEKPMPTVRTPGGDGAKVEEPKV